MDDLKVLQQQACKDRLELESLQHELAAERSRRQNLEARLAAARTEAERSLQVINLFNADVKHEVAARRHTYTRCCDSISGRDKCVKCAMSFTRPAQSVHSL